MCLNCMHYTDGTCGAFANAMRGRIRNLRIKLSFETRKSERMVHSEGEHEDNGKTNTAQAAAASLGHAAQHTCEVVTDHTPVVPRAPVFDEYTVVCCTHDLRRTELI